jgi:DNA modification methylase
VKPPKVVREISEEEKREKEKAWSEARLIRGINAGKPIFWEYMEKPEEFDYLAIQPIVEPSPPRRQEAKRHYGVHPYFTRRSYNVVQEYIKRFTQPGDLVVDPFGGSGVTAIEALVLRRRAVHIDINPLANFITKCAAVAPVDVNTLQSEFERIEKQVKPYVKKIEKMTEEEVAKLPIRDWYPKDARLPLNADRQYVHELFSPKQLRILAKIRSSVLRIDDETVRELMLYVFSSTVTKCNLLFSGAKGRKQTRGNTSPIQVYRYWMPPNPVVLSPWDEFKSKFRKFLVMKGETNEVIGDYYKDNSLHICKGDAAGLTGIMRPEVADYVYTDPPYGANIAYLDLSTMWNAWLGFEVTQADKEAEVIENGDLNKTREDYVRLLRQSITEIFRILKWNRWFSLVFAHKDPLFWDTIIKTTESCGFQYVNTAVVHAGIVSYHKHKNPLHVLSGELVINFLKKKNPRALSVSRVGVQAVNLILNSAELAIVRHDDGATTEEIHHELIPKLIEAGMLSELREKISDITPLVADKFDFNSRTGRWQLQPNTKLGSYIPVDLRIKFYIESFLNQCSRLGQKATFDTIWADLMPKLKNGPQPQHQKILSELGKIAEPYNGLYWRLQPAFQGEIFDELDLECREYGESGLSEWLVVEEDEVEHNDIIYRLALLGQAIGFKCHVGRNERSIGEDSDKLAALSLQQLPKTFKLNKYGKKKVEQIDLIWFDEAGFSAYAFEVEKSTAITTGIERFIELLKVSLRVSGKVILVCPSSRRGKMDEVLSESPFIGEPMYMENKLKYLLFQDIIALYHQCYRRKLTLEFVSVEIRKLLKSPEIAKR